MPGSKRTSDTEKLMDKRNSQRPEKLRPASFNGRQLGHLSKTYRSVSKYILAQLRRFQPF